MGYKIIKDKIAVATKPLYNAFIIFFDCPSFTKKVPTIDVKIQAAPILNG